MHSSVLERPLFATFIPAQQPQAGKASAERLAEPRSSWCKGIDTQVQDRRSRNTLTELRRDTDYWTQFLVSVTKDIKDKPSIIEDLFADQEQALDDLEHTINIAESNLPIYAKMEEVTKESGRLETSLVIEKLMDSLRNFIVAGEDFSWHVNIYEAQKRPRTGIICDSAEEFKRALRGAEEARC